MEKQSMSIFDETSKLLINTICPGYIRFLDDAGWEWMDHPDGRVCIEWHPEGGYIFHGQEEDDG